jgi:hypothetical protein
LKIALLTTLVIYLLRRSSLYLYILPVLECQTGDTQERFNRSPSVISKYKSSVKNPGMLLILYVRCFHEVIDALLLLYKSNVKLPSSDISVSTRISDNSKTFAEFILSDIALG